MSKLNEPDKSCRKQIEIKERAEFSVPLYQNGRIEMLTKVGADIAAEELESEENFLKAVKRAVTSWINAGGEGMAAWQESSRDFNIGDLALYLEGESGLRGFAEKEGLFNLSAESSAQAPAFWHHDTILADTAFISDTED